MDLPEILERMTAAPARILGLDAGTLRPGAPADVCVFDPAMKWTFTQDDIGSKSSNSPFLGRELTGRVLLTLLDGRATWESPEARKRLVAPRSGSPVETGAR